MALGLRNVVVIGGSYVGVNAAKELASLLPTTHRVLLIDPHSHFNHLFAFVSGLEARESPHLSKSLLLSDLCESSQPSRMDKEWSGSHGKFMLTAPQPRFAILPGHEHKAFIPYSGVFAASPNKHLHALIQAKVVSVKPKELTLDREWQGSRQLPFDYLVAATGTQLAAPGSMPSDEKKPSVEYLQRYNRGIRDARSVIIVGGGAVGVQMACDLKELYPDKEVTLVHSRDHIMPAYDERLSDMIKTRFAELGVRFIGGSRVTNIPALGFPIGGGGGKPITVSLHDAHTNTGNTLSADFVVQATGQVPNTHFLHGLPPSGPDSLVNPQNGFILVCPTLQFADAAYAHMYAVGDIADSGAHKAARPGAGQAAVAARNILAMIEGREVSEQIVVGPAAIHLTLGLTKNTIFRNPNTTAGETEPFINLKDDGSADMNIDAVWVRRGVTVSDPQEYQL